MPAASASWAGKGGVGGARCSGAAPACDSGGSAEPAPDWGQRPTARGRHPRLDLARGSGATGRCRVGTGFAAAWYPAAAASRPTGSGRRPGRSLPWASSLCGACYEVCPVEIDIPRVLVHLRGRVVDSEPAWKPEKAAMKAMYRAFASRRAYERAQRVARLGARPLGRRGRIERLPSPLSGWTGTRDFPEPPAETFRDWWRRERGEPGSGRVPRGRETARGLRLPELFRST
jgi:ferredoxin